MEFIWRRKHEGELIALTAELFETTPGLSWDDAEKQAEQMFPALQTFIEEWDAQAERDHLFCLILDEGTNIQ